jgi:hypothetical protein
MRLKTVVVPCTGVTMTGQAKDPTPQVDSIVCSGLHTSGKHPKGLRRLVLI